ncbi:hypothetical protein GCM10027610_044550 [Dactylosporangium cerinum]
MPHQVAWLLVEGGRLDVLRAEAGEGDWNCGEALAGELARRGEVDAALEIYGAFAPPGRWSLAAEKIIAALETSRGVDETIAFLRPYVAAGDPSAVHRLASLLGRHGRVDEAIELLRPSLDDWWSAETLVQATAGQGRDEDVIAELEALVAAVERQPGISTACTSTACTSKACTSKACTSNAPECLATVLQRQGRSDEAIALLRRVRGNHGQHLAELLRDCGRESDLRELVAGGGPDNAAHCLAELLERQNRAAEAVEVLRAVAGSGGTNEAIALTTLLQRHGRVDEAVDVLLAAIRAEAATEVGTTLTLWTMLIEEGRAEEALGHLDELEHEFGIDDVRHNRILLLTECGRREEALDRLRARPEAGHHFDLQAATRLLDELGRADEAIALLRPRATEHFVGGDLAELLLRRGDVDEAMAVLHGREPLVLWSTPAA